MEIIIALIGVVVGFLLSEISSWVKDRMKKSQMKNAIDQELISLRSQIPQLKSICARAIDELNSRALLPTLNVPAITKAYDCFGNQVQPLLTTKERNCLHIIYERLKVADKILSELEQDFQTSMSLGVITDPFVAYADKLSDIHSSYDVINQLIDSYLNGTPIDVFQIESESNQSLKGTK